MSKQYNAEEAAICKRRGHKSSGVGIMGNGKWGKCEYCGTWAREVTTLEEREDEPPAEEQHPMERS